VKEREETHQPQQYGNTKNILIPLEIAGAGIEPAT
tara:strand:+ start:110 stop:214 length:105 start_codon:yes stop_codon:yes gene_type:complete